jgi:Tol biopolymer transport system component
MFRTLFFKEWKEKLAIFAFGLGLLALALAVNLGLTKNADTRELVTGGLLALYFPFMALLIGAGGFEPESRNDAWAYLFSRPVGKGAVWAVKYLSLLSQLACLWLVFLATMVAVPGLKALVSGFRLPIAFGTELQFLPWSLVISLFFFTLAFSLSPFSANWLNLLFGSLFIGLILAFIAYWASTFVTVLLRDDWFDEKKWLHAFRWNLLLMGVAAGLASLLTLTRVDFSQPRKKIARFAGLAAPCLVAALLIAAAWTALLPRSGDRFIYMLDRSGGATYFQTDKGLFSYDWDREKTKRLTRGRAGIYESSPIRGGKMVFYDVDLSVKKYKPTVLWSMNTDGSQETRLVGGGFKPEDPRSQLSPNMFLLSPDGKQVVFFDLGALFAKGNTGSPLWAINTDGSGLRNLALPEALTKGRGTDFYLNLMAWPAASPSCILLTQRPNGPQGRPKLWLYNLGDKSSRVLLDDARLIWYGGISPRGDYLVFSSSSTSGPGWRLNILDLKSLDLKAPDLKEVEIPGWRFAYRATWSPKGDKLAFLARQGITPGKGKFALMVVSTAEWKVLASKELTEDEKAGQSYSFDWLEDNARLVLCDPTERTLSVLGPDLSEEKRIAVPAPIAAPFGFRVSGDKALVIDGERNTLWRLNLRTEGWKRVY